MDESQAYGTLVIILSVTLAVFLILAIIATTWLIRVLKRVNRITEKAEEVANNIEQASENFRKVSGPAAVIQALSKILKK